MKVIALALILMSGSAPQKMQFDLVCTAAAVTDDGHGAFERKDVHLRVDLTKKQWCEEPPPEYAYVKPCASPKTIATIEPAAIWFEKATDEQEARGIAHWSEVNRVTGRYTYVHDLLTEGHKDTIAIVSQCSPAPFSGFPAIQTKF
jgi:hypothetical protein